MAIFDSLIFDSLIFDTGAAAGVSGTSTVTLGGVTQAGSGVVPVQGSQAGSLAGVSQSAAGQVAAKGSASVTLAGVGQTAAGRVPVTGTGAVTLGGVSPSGQGVVPVRGAAAQTLDGVTQSGAGNVPQPLVTGLGFAILQGIVQLGAGTVSTPAEPPYDWAPPLQADTSAIVGQALRFMRMPPLARFASEAELRGAVAEAFDQAIDDCLAAADWSFASTLAHLPASSPGLVAEAELPVTATLPGDLIRLRELRPAGARWRLDAGALRTDAPAPVTIRYTARITREEALPATFKTAVALHVALRLGPRWAGGSVDPDELAYMAALTLKQSMREDGRHASAARAVPQPDLGYGAGDGDWALEAVA